MGVTGSAAHAGTKAHLETKRWNSWAKHLTSGAVGAVTSAFVRVPTDTIRHRVQAYLHPNVMRAVPELARAKGLAGFYSGFLPTIMRDVPEIALQFGMYEALRGAVQWHAGGGDAKLPTWQHLLLGGAAGAFATSVTMPIDVIKTHLQCGDKAARQAGPWRTFTHLCAHNRAGLWAGMVRVPRPTSPSMAQHGTARRRHTLLRWPAWAFARDLSHTGGHQHAVAGVPALRLQCLWLWSMHGVWPQVTCVAGAHAPSATGWVAPCCVAMRVGMVRPNVKEIQWVKVSPMHWRGCLVGAWGEGAVRVGRRPGGGDGGGGVQGPRMAQNVLMSAMFFTLFEFWKAQLKPASQREGSDRLLSKKLYDKPRDHIWKRQFSFR